MFWLYWVILPLKHMFDTYIAFDETLFISEIRVPNSLALDSALAYL